MSFIAAERASVPSLPEEATVTNDGFFPAIDLQRLRDSVRLDGTVTALRLRNAVVDAMLHVNDELAGWKAAQVAAGVTGLDQLEPTIGGEAVQLHRYLAAIYRTVKADLNEQFRNLDTTKAGVDDADKLLQLVEDERRAAKLAIRAFLGVPQSTVELI